jgi:putative Mn2+ efflux pump MntP
MIVKIEQFKGLIMFSLEISLLGLALAIDAAVATFALGLIGLDIPTRHKWARGFAIAGLFGLFQFLMVWLGSFGGYIFSFSNYGHLFHLIVATIFIIIAIKLFQESGSDDKKEMVWGFVPMVVIAIATSIDALAAGISFGTLPHAEIAALEIGIITFGLCGAFYVVSQFFQNIPHRWLLRLAGFIFLILVARIVWQFVNRGNA